MIAFDPVAMDNARSLLSNSRGVSFAARAMEAVNGCDALIIATEWREFSSPDFSALKSALRTPVIFDGRNLYDPDYVSSFGLEYHAIGRGVPGTADADQRTPNHPAADKLK